ncbi:glycosyltransferase family 9 protein [Cytophagaceae bacterium YF14B1]|uniref:Glycosyltransferase family 9 protein n=1 Tax=Xanthocytophaga flava TaxID=3048013 RepID=A0AAE3QLK0_9BACT|nr:glycosyltransferase family 9 protein [Xanthocytophaga flavus]MDJ1479156.1 glycosyltransferase family 9 protein [Xanthocytophaga flavus]
MKVLIIRFSAIGDIVLASPAIRCLRKSFPDAEIHFLTKKSFKAVTEANPYVNRFHYYDKSVKELLPELKQASFDYIIDLQNNGRSLRIKNALPAKAYTINKLNIQKFLLTTFRLDFMPKRHITQRSLDVIRKIGAEDDGLGLDYFVPAVDEVNWTILPVTHQQGYVAIVIGASYPTKKMPVHKLKELCTRLPFPVVLLGGKEEIEEGEQIASVDPAKVFNGCGKFNLNQSADLVRKSTLVISHDTGLQYIASAFQKPTFAIWGSTSPKLDVEPYYGSSFQNTGHLSIYENIQVPGLKCQPCSKYGNRKCPLGHFNCMEKQDIDLIVAKVQAKLSDLQVFLPKHRTEVS